MSPILPRSRAARFLPDIGMPLLYGEEEEEMSLPQTAFFYALVLSSFASVNTPVTAVDGISELRRDDRVEFEIPSGPAEATLQAFTEASQVLVIYVFEQLQGIRTHAVKGRYTPREALDRMLADTPLSVVVDAESGSLIVQLQDRASVAPASTNDHVVSAATMTSDRKPQNPVRALLGALLIGSAGATAPAQAQTETPEGAEEIIEFSPFVIDSS
ncbi:MAG: hypothetical protein HC841_04795, partial [Verrucomicrobiae bacterium]|nr:hypothetical protein [Verrucomicrobiae bacterium]